jgi:aryl-alcohol dehydrogenase
MKIKAAVVRKESGPFEIEEVELDDPRENEVLVRIAGCGVCHTDLVARDQYVPVPLPAVFGHEGAGVVERVGSHVAKVKPGDHVVMSFLSCGNCPSCKKGLPSYCSDFLKSNLSAARSDGSSTIRKGKEIIHSPFFGQSAFATHCLATEQNVVKVAEDIPLDLLGPLGCGVQTGAGSVMNGLKPEAGSSIAIFGVGSVGLSAVLASIVCGCSVIIAVDIHPGRLKTAIEFGATHAVNSKQTEPVAEIQRITGRGVDFSIECVGHPEVLRQAVDSLALTGVCGLVGVSALGVEVVLDMHSILDGRTVRGIAEGDSIPDIFIPRLIELYRQGRFAFDRMITFYPFEQINQAVEDSEKGRVLKAVLRP